MGAALAKRSSIASDLFAEAGEILGFDLLELCTNGSAERLNRTEFSQPALFVHSFAALKQLESEQATLWDSVHSVAGLSLGEYTAVAAAGGITFADGVRLVSTRGKAMQAAADAVESGMSSILGIDAEKLQAVCEEASSDDCYVRVANLLCPGNIAISGHIPALERAEVLSTEAGAIRAIRLQVAGAFHTEIMRSAVETLENALADVPFQRTSIPVVSNVDASPHLEPDEIRDLLAKQVVTPVLWESSLNSMIKSGTEKFIEVGPGRVLAGTLKRINRKMPCENFGD